MPQFDETKHELTNACLTEINDRPMRWIKLWQWKDVMNGLWKCETYGIRIWSLAIKLWTYQTETAFNIKYEKELTKFAAYVFKYMRKQLYILLWTKTTEQLR